MKEIEELSDTLVVHEEQIQPIETHKITRKLGVQMTPTLNWKRQFEIMKNKLNLSISKLMQTNVNPFQAAMYYNTYVIKSVYFGCSIVELTNKQEEELKRTHE